MNISKKLRFEVFNRDEFKCRYCGRKTPEVILEIDHVILKDKDLHNETLLLAEKELQLAEYNHPKKAIRERENKEIEELKNYFVNHFQNALPGYSESEFPDNMFRRCLKIMSYVDIFELIEMAVDVTSRDSKGDYPVVAAGKYLSGILKNKLKGKPEIIGTIGAP